MVMGLRAVMCLNPTFQILARTLARDAELLATMRNNTKAANRAPQAPTAAPRVCTSCEASAAIAMRSMR